MRLDEFQRRALFDLVCWFLVMAVLLVFLGSMVGCVTGVGAKRPTAPDVPPQPMRAVSAAGVAAANAVTTTTVPRFFPQIVRLDSHRCVVAADETAVYYEQDGITRVMSAPFNCTTAGVAKQRWGSGTRTVVVEYIDGQRVSFAEYWPEATQ